MKITKKSFYAIQALLYLGNNPDRVITSVEICKKQNIPKPFLQRIFSELSRKGITESIKGPLGGQKLKVALSEITVWRIMDAIGEPVISNKSTTPNISKIKEHDVVENYLSEFDNLIETNLLSLTLEDISRGNFSPPSLVVTENDEANKKILDEINPDLSEDELNQ